MDDKYWSAPSEHPYWWMFTDDTIGMSDADLGKLHFLRESYALVIWASTIRPFLQRMDYSASQRFDWEEEWDDSRSQFPSSILPQDAASPEDMLYFAWSPRMAVETTWAVFRRNWKCFLFHDEGPVLLVGGRLVQFLPDGKCVRGG